jgi:hypothetical protein
VQFDSLIRPDITQVLFRIAPSIVQLGRIPTKQGKREKVT